MKKNYRGFTIVELMIATSIFSVILLTGTTLIVQIGKMYYKGITANRLQDNAREIMDQLSKSVQFSPADPIIIDPASAVNYQGCILFPDSTRYTYVINKKVSNTQHALWKDNIASCLISDQPNLNSSNPSANGNEVLGYNTRIVDLTIGYDSSNGKAELFVHLIYGDDDLIEFADPVTKIYPIDCKIGNSGSQWCHSVKLQSTVYKRQGL